MNTKILDRLAWAEKFFSNTRYKKLVESAYELCMDGKYKQASKKLDKLPDEKELMNNILEKIAHKSVGKTIKKIDEGKVKSVNEALKGLFSLGTHTAIEAEKYPEYKCLYSTIYERIGRMLFELD